MTVGITCQECGSDVTFHVDEYETAWPQEECDCGVVYKLMVKRVYPAP